MVFEKSFILQVYKFIVDNTEGQ